MRKFAVILLAMLALTFGMRSTADAGVSFGVSIGHGGYYGYPSYNCGPYYGSYYRYPRAYSYYPRHIRYQRGYSHYRPRAYYGHRSPVYYGRVCY